MSFKQFMKTYLLHKLKLFEIEHLILWEKEQNLNEGFFKRPLKLIFGEEPMRVFNTVSVQLKIQQCVHFIGGVGQVGFVLDRKCQEYVVQHSTHESFLKGEHHREELPWKEACWYG